ncbi:conjugal transfer protein [Streptomyces nanshensis]|uniref:conjugal transfer protein n=1 Tax=Streptomyces nanshensis TaxID=518642 RepID=UPI00085C9AAC|nr:conjugal transfer protein [Streptomyces nanshensis]
MRKMLSLSKPGQTSDEHSHAATAASSHDVPQTPERETASVHWEEEEEPRRRAWARRGGRVVIWALIALAIVSGVRSWLYPATPPSTGRDAGQEQRHNAVPETQAQLIGARFARSYMTWDSRSPKAREKELARDLAKGADATMGWDGSGAQVAAQAIPGPVTQRGDHRARVRVDVRVSYNSGRSGKEVTSAWRGLEVPVTETHGRVLVTGQPALVGLPTPVPYDEPDAPASDSGLSADTRRTVKDFLTAWAEGSEDQAAAPGADIEPLGDGIALASLGDWAIDEGSGHKRTGTATVTWKLAGGELQQTYRITLTTVSASAASRWQVQAVTSSG